jgi:hypothetical protein
MTGKSLFLLIFLFAVFYSPAQVTDSVRVKRNPFEMKDRKIPAFSGTGLDGTPWNDDSLRGKVTLFVFWEIGCMACMTVHPGRVYAGRG